VNVSDVFTPVAVELIDAQFGTDITFHRRRGGGYNPQTGVVTTASSDHPIKAGIISRSRIEEGGSNEAYTVSLWIHHGASGLAFLPHTSDTFTYDGLVWRVTEVAPTYSAATLIASKIKGRA